ncbi:lipopolysaccharide biosynthesis protein [Burkholderia singularis]|uniref:Permeases of the major facilitator superfamily n=1 Tax=Burkholderia singularis TaxID=1503053 RepID=A0A238H812_9BURK|nr:phosphoribosylaminoimidazole carboxylase [Burkholderia singularis]SMG01591.1 Permeases of the major facilitator superfamily [Burkholderia singularis]
MLTRLLLRVSALGAKFALTLVVARVLGFGAVADYGLAVAASVIASKLFGLGFSAEINRRLAAAEPREAIRDARRIGGVYAAFYALVAAAGALCTDAYAWFGASTASAGAAVLAVVIAEHYAFEANSYVFSLHRTDAGARMMFVRTGLWPAFAIAGLAAGWIGRIETVLWMWAGANAVVIVWAWASIARLARAAQPPGPHAGHVEHAEPAGPAKRGAAAAGRLWRDGAAFYVGAVLLSAMQYGERFVADRLLGHDALGRYVFGWSIANSVQTVSYAVLVVMAAPVLARAASDAPAKFVPLVMRFVGRAGALTLALSGVIAVLGAPIFRLAHETPGPDGTFVLAALLVSFVVRSIADIAWVAAVALREGRRVASGMAVLGALSIANDWLLIGRFGATGAALAHLCASVAIAGWLAWVIRRRAPCASAGSAGPVPRAGVAAAWDAQAGPAAPGAVHREAREGRHVA